MEEIQKAVSKITDSEVLYIYAFNYNWDNGFDILYEIINSDYCELSTALLLFFRGDGEQLLYNHIFEDGNREWIKFIKILYAKIINNHYNRGGIAFKNPLSKVEIYKLKKQISDQEAIFLESLDGKNLDIVI